MKKIPITLIAVSALSLAGCVSVPTGPTIPVSPGQNKAFAAFQQDDDFCQGYASDKVAGRVNEANDRAVRNGLIGTAIGVGVGAAVGNTRGAVVGGTAGGLIGSDAGGSGSQYGIQRQYNVAYAQCMESRGNRVPGWDNGPPDRGDYGPPRDHGDYRDYPPPPPPPPGY